MSLDGSPRLKTHHTSCHQFQQVLADQWFVSASCTCHALRRHQHNLPHLPAQSRLLDAKHIETLSFVLWQCPQTCDQLPKVLAAPEKSIGRSGLPVSWMEISCFRIGLLSTW